MVKKIGGKTPKPILPRTRFYNKTASYIPHSTENPEESSEKWERSRGVDMSIGLYDFRRTNQSTK
jgi:hypothetical protein